MCVGDTNVASSPYCWVVVDVAVVRKGVAKTVQEASRSASARGPGARSHSPWDSPSPAWFGRTEFSRHQERASLSRTTTRDSLRFSSHSWFERRKASLVIAGNRSFSLAAKTLRVFATSRKARSAFRTTSLVRLRCLPRRGSTKDSLRSPSELSFAALTRTPSGRRLPVPPEAVYVVFIA